MKRILYVTLIICGILFRGFGQNESLSPLNNPANRDLIKSETTEMDWFILKDTLKVPIGIVKTEIQQKGERLYLITTVDMKQVPGAWIDSTIVESLDFKPIYHSSYNPQRDMVLQFREKVTGYYWDKQLGTKTTIAEEATGSFFDSNFYPQLIRLLPLEAGYSGTIAIFDYNPAAKIGVMKASIRNTEAAAFTFKGEEKSIWKVEVTDEISNNAAISTYYIDTLTRRILKQEIDFGGRKMLMEMVE